MLNLLVPDDFCYTVFVVLLCFHVCIHGLVCSFCLGLSFVCNAYIGHLCTYICHFVLTSSLLGIVLPILLLSSHVIQFLPLPFFLHSSILYDLLLWSW